jgi:hypothetical protein
MQLLVLRGALRDDARLENAMTDDPPPDSKLTRSKQRWASEHKFITGAVDRSVTSACRRASI